MCVCVVCVCERERVLKGVCVCVLSAVFMEE